MAQDSIFEFADKFGVESPFGNWMKEVEEKAQSRKLAAGFVQASTNGDMVEIVIVVHAAKLKSTDFRFELQESDVFFNDAIQNYTHRDSRTEFSIKFKVPRDKIDAQVSYFEGTPEFVVVVTCDGMSATTREFVIPDEVKGSVAYYVYADGTIEKHLPDGYDETKAKHIDYYYVDKNKVEHFIATTAASMVQKRKDGKKGLTSIPNGWTKKEQYPAGGDAKNGYHYANGDIVVDGVKPRYGIVRYPIAEGKVQLIRMPDQLSFEEDGIKIMYSFLDSQRRYCNPESFAGFIGALAETSFEDIICTGMCFADSTSYPSVSHPNGDSADTAYLNTKSREQKKIDAFKNFHFKNILRGQGWTVVGGVKVYKTPWLGELVNSKYSSGHETHLHAGDFDSTKITVKKK